MKRPLLQLILCAVFFAGVLAGCGGGGKAPALLESEKRLAGMYEACQKIQLTDGESKQTIHTGELAALGSVEIEAVLKRANGMEKPGKWAGTPFAAVLDSKGVAKPFKELRIEAWDGYVGRISFDISQRPDTILADREDGKSLPREDGPVRLVVASEDGFYWMRMITRIEVIR
jgi:DMSO/TMAO reductase YedYZ molybdopterin-dependent catalytic subunit